MKKLLSIILILMLLVGCSPMQKDLSVTETDAADTYITGVWISYAELDNLLANGDFKNQFNTVLSNCKARGITDVFVHTRAFCDSIYSSQYFPLRESVAGYDFDILEYMISQCHLADINFHAWINPYRVRTADSDIENLPENSYARIWLQDSDPSNDTNVCFSDGIYLCPASSEARQVVIDGIREIIGKYAVDGIHFDDYFYPTQDTAFDAAAYAAYCEDAQKPLTLSDWRRANVNALISGCFTAIKFTDADIIFSISPSASIDNNYNRYYADVGAWVNSGCVDYIIPQLYFGFEYPDSNLGFDNLVAEWQSIVKDTDTKLLIGLASYKINTQNEPDRAEWADGIKVIKKQTEICKQTNGISGHMYFSYSSMQKYL